MKDHLALRPIVTGFVMILIGLVITSVVFQWSMDLPRSLDVALANIAAGLFVTASIFLLVGVYRVAVAVIHRLRGEGGEKTCEDLNIAGQPYSAWKLLTALAAGALAFLVALFFTHRAVLTFHQTLARETAMPGPALSETSLRAAAFQDRVRVQLLSGLGTVRRPFSEDTILRHVFVDIFAADSGKLDGVIVPGCKINQWSASSEPAINPGQGREGVYHYWVDCLADAPSANWPSTLTVGVEYGANVRTFSVKRAPWYADSQSLVSYSNDWSGDAHRPALGAPDSAPVPDPSRWLYVGVADTDGAANRGLTAIEFMPCPVAQIFHIAGFGNAAYTVAAWLPRPVVAPDFCIFRYENGSTRRVSLDARRRPVGLRVITYRAHSSASGAGRERKLRLTARRQREEDSQGDVHGQTPSHAHGR